MEARPLMPGARLPSLDGWRALAILMVLGEHTEYTYDFPKGALPAFKWIFDGNLGVRLFFVLSGFLITTILLQEYARTDAVNLRRFYARRALRILPVYFAFLGVIALVQFYTPARQGWITWLGNLTFTTNFVEKPFFTFHLWSLAIEEQFYLLWPLLLVWSGLSNTRRLLRILIIPVLVSPLCKLIVCTGYIVFVPASLEFLFQPFSSLYYFDSLALGCIAAVLFDRYKAKLELNQSPFLSGGVGAALLLLPWFAQKLNMFPVFTGVTGSVCQATGFAILMVQSVLFPRYFKPFNWAVVRRLGILSYSIYIWHMPFCAKPETFGLTRPWFMSCYTWWVPVLLVALASYHFLEMPFLALRTRLRVASKNSRS